MTPRGNPATLRHVAEALAREAVSMGPHDADEAATERLLYAVAEELRRRAEREAGDGQ